MTVVWDLWLRAKIGRVKASFSRRHQNEQREEEERTEATSPVALEERTPEAGGAQRRSGVSSRNSIAAIPTQPANVGSESKERIAGEETAPTPQTIDMVSHAIPVKIGLAIIAGFFGISPVSLCKIS